MSRRLLLLRHGRTAWNDAGRAQGHADIELDATGHAQAELAARHLADLEIAGLWASDLTRARQTAGYLADRTGLGVDEDARLREFDVGERQGLTLAEFADRFPEEYSAWMRGDGLVPVKGGEVSEEVEARMVPALRECLDALDHGETGLVVTHGAAMKVAVTGLLQWPLELAASLKAVDNCAWITLDEIEHGGRLRLAGYNEKAPRERSH
ncbi:MAG TPA: histidine phosphatase family protein [Nocardioidaceae bacterium]|nr:histidine phosphatase family protein [Nocardioidaceae bacterium]